MGNEMSNEMSNEMGNAKWLWNTNKFYFWGASISTLIFFGTDDKNADKFRMVCKSDVNNSLIE